MKKLTLILLIIGCFFNCVGERATVKKKGTDYIITHRGDTIISNKRVLRALKKDRSYIIWLTKKGKVKNATAVNDNEY